LGVKPDRAIITEGMLKVFEEGEKEIIVGENGEDWKKIPI
jgi:hypothetical protein